MARAGLCPLAVLLLATLFPEPSRADVTAVKRDYHGWKEAIRLSNGTVELVFVPQVGRIMRYGYTGRANVLWENPGMAGKVVSASPDRKEWANFGGDKLWPAPQERWGWPPDPEIDPGTQTTRVLPNGHLLVTGSPSAKHGVRFTREIAMDKAGTGVTIVNAMTNTSGVEQRWSVWEIAQTDDPEAAFIPAHGAGRGEYVQISKETPGAGVVGVVKGFARVRRDPKAGGKIGSRSREGWAAAEKAGARFRMAAVSSSMKGDYPDGGCPQEIYWNADPDRYVELELLGPVVTLPPGKTVRFTVRWTLDRVK